MNNKIFISDIHFQHLNLNDSSNIEKYSKHILSSLEYGFINNNSKKVDIYIVGDLFNYLDFGNSLIKIYKKNNIKALDFYFNIINDFINQKQLILGNAFYVNGNHEYYNNFPKTEFNFLNNSKNVVDNIINDSFFKTFNKRIHSLQKGGGFLHNDLAIVGNMLYTSGNKIEDLKRNSPALNFIGKVIFTRLNDPLEFSKIFDKGIEEFINQNNGNLYQILGIKNFLEFEKSLNDDLLAILNFLKKSIKNIDDNGTFSYTKSFGMMSNFIFSFFLIKLVGDIFKISLIKSDILTLDILTHHPFNFLGREIYQDIISMEKIEAKYLFLEEFGDSLNNAFEIDTSFVIILIDYIESLFPKLTNLNFFGGHNHHPLILKMKTNRQIKNITYYNNAIGHIK